MSETTKTPDDTTGERLVHSMAWADAAAGKCRDCDATWTHLTITPEGSLLDLFCIDHAFEATVEAQVHGRWKVRAIAGATWALALRAEVLRLRAVRDAAQEYVEQMSTEGAKAAWRCSDAAGEAWVALREAVAR